MLLMKIADSHPTQSNDEITGEADEVKNKTIDVIGESLGLKDDEGYCEETVCLAVWRRSMLLSGQKENKGANKTFYISKSLLNAMR